MTMPLGTLHKSADGMLRSRRLHGQMVSEGLRPCKNSPNSKTRRMTFLRSFKICTQSLALL
jgi:hypothetical protein